MKYVKVFIKILLVVIIFNINSFFSNHLESNANSNNDEANITISSEMIDVDDSFTVEFVFEEIIIDYYYVESGVTVIDSSFGSNYVLFELTALDGECRFELFLSFVDDVYQKNTIYTFSTEGIVFVKLKVVQNLTLIG